MSNGSGVASTLSSAAPMCPQPSSMCCRMCCEGCCL